MNRVRVLLICLAAAVLTAGAGFVFGVIPLTRGQDSARPPCAQLPDRRSVVDAVAAHEDLATRMRQVGPGVQVTVASPCANQPDRALVSIKYTTDAEREGVAAILQHEGFGVAAELVKK